MFPMPNKEQILSILRNLLSLGAGYFIAKGTITVEQAATITNEIMVAAPAVIGIGVFIWGLRAHTDKSKVEAVASMPAPAVNEALSKVSDVAKAQIIEATPGIATVVVEPNANHGLQQLAQSGEHPKIVTTVQNEQDAKNGTGGTKS